MKEKKIKKTIPSWFILLIILAVAGFFRFVGLDQIPPELMSMKALLAITLTQLKKQVLTNGANIHRFYPMATVSRRVNLC